MSSKTNKKTKIDMQKPFVNDNIGKGFIDNNSKNKYFVKYHDQIHNVSHKKCSHIT